MQDSMMEGFQKFFKPITEWKHFDTFTGIVSLLNPAALLPQLWGVIISENVEAISIGMWMIFVIIQSTFALVAVKGRNLGMFASMLISILISLSIITIVWFKT